MKVCIELTDQEAHLLVAAARSFFPAASQIDGRHLACAAGALLSVRLGQLHATAEAPAPAPAATTPNGGAR